jgi:hypothetical protein
LSDLQAEVRASSVTGSGVNFASIKYSFRDHAAACVEQADSDVLNVMLTRLRDGFEPPAKPRGPIAMAKRINCVHERLRKAVMDLKPDDRSELYPALHNLDEAVATLINAAPSEVASTNEIGGQENL